MQAKSQLYARHAAVINKFLRLGCGIAGDRLKRPRQDLKSGLGLVVCVERVISICCLCGDIFEDGLDSVAAGIGVVSHHTAGELVVVGFLIELAAVNTRTIEAGDGLVFCG